MSDPDATHPIRSLVRSHTCAKAEAPNVKGSNPLSRVGNITIEGRRKDKSDSYAFEMGLLEAADPVFQIRR